MPGGDDQIILKLVDGLRFEAGPDLWSLEPIKIRSGSWVSLVPSGEEPVVDPSGPLAFSLATMAEPLRGTVELFDQDVYHLDYVTRQHLRARIGFVHSFGGLLSNRTVRENIALPASVHGRLTAAEEKELVSHLLEDLALDRVADLKPHEMDGSTRWRACLARALVLNPQWLVLEGIGNWEMARGQDVGWTYLLECQRKGEMATAICLPRRNPGFESWFAKHDGEIIHYSKHESSLKELA